MPKLSQPEPFTRLTLARTKHLRGGRVRLTLVIEANTGRAAPGEKMNWLASLNTQKMIQIEGLWPDPMMVNFVVKAYVKLSDRQLRALRRSAALERIKLGTAAIL